ncbi:hypothetical protein CMV30_18840 [Nibricoccus aquaticus]|uniref:Integrase n=1 Tax=Nibricoccus aquaticus TaxID=2576891 RepID=A0A290QAZ5_9BACT|nr:hypothetical protein [Nibricoccus aquaticus]ATC65839.1 hypothetical protein CMV30_18840 [Nibricoccus aquaticus]
MQKTLTWKRTTVEGLYENTHSGIFYSRYRLNGKRTFRSLGTTVLTVAKLKHAKRAVTVETDRQRGADIGSKFKTLGALLAETQRRLKANTVAENTTIGRAGNIARLQTHWVRGNFASFLARNVTADVIAELREHLLKTAEWKWKFQKKTHRGFKAPTVNQTLWVLRVMLDIAVEKMVLIENPFAISSTLRQQLFAKVKTPPQKAIPDRSVMLRIFAEMRRVPDRSERFNPNPEQRAWLEENAAEMADHAELLAYSGMRKEEATLSTLPPTTV